MVKKSNTSPISEKNIIDTVNKTEKSQTSKEAVSTSKNNRTDTFETIDKSRSTPITDLSNKNFHIEKPQK